MLEHKRVRRRPWRIRRWVQADGGGGAMRSCGRVAVGEVPCMYRVQGLVLRLPRGREIWHFAKTIEDGRSIWIFIMRREHYFLLLSCPPPPQMLSLFGIFSHH